MPSCGDAVRAVLACYPAAHPAGRVEPLGNAGGFSGARFWRVESAGGTLCLRGWPPEHPTPQGLCQIHAVLLHVARAGLRIVPAPLPTGSGSSYVEWGGRLWELAPWMPGEANYRRAPTPAKLRSAMRSLAVFHTLAAEFPDADREPAPASGILERRELLARWTRGGVEQLRRAVRAAAGGPLDERAQRLLLLFPRLAAQVADQLERASQHAVAQQPCIRDIWHNHVLFTGEEVSGLVDFGALRRDHVAADIARLLGSLVGDDERQRQIGLQAYEEVRTLDMAERQLIDAYDASSVLLSGMNWLRWVYLEKRHFESPAAVLARVDENLARVERAVQRR